MAKEILLYGGISEYNAMFFHEQIKEVLEEDENADFVVLVNSEGGQPEYGVSIIQKIQRMADRMSLDIGAMAHSMAFFLMCYVNKSRIVVQDVTKSIIHRAAYPDWLESAPWFKGSVYDELLAKTNKDLEKALRASVDIEAFESLPQMKEKNITIKDIFSMESRIEVLLSGSDLKKIGLASKVNRVTPTKEAQLKASAEKFNSLRSLKEFKMAAESIKTTEPKTATVMTLEELKSQHPAIYAQAVAEGVAKEKSRVEAFMVFAKDDLEGVQKGIESGVEMSPKQLAEFTHKMAGKKLTAAVAEGNPAAVTTTEPPKAEGPKAEKEKEHADFLKSVKAQVELLNPKAKQ